LREGQVARVIADSAGPLRTCAANLLALEGEAPPSPKAALEQLTQRLGEDWSETLADITRARTGEALAPGVAERTLVRLIDLAERMRARARELR
jgi:hypothetical protein